MSAEPKDDYSVAKANFSLVWVPIIAALIFVGIYFVYFAIIDKHPTGAPENWGQFGDFVGGLLNPIVGVVTIVLLVRTLRAQNVSIDMQRKELALQRRELQLQRAETARSAAALDAQYRAIVMQSFEQTFFAWLGAYTGLVAGLESREAPGNVLKGPDALQSMVARDAPSIEMSAFAIERFQEGSIEDQDAERSDLKSDISGWWGDVYQHNEPQFGTFYRTLFTLIRWIDAHPALSPTDRWNYVSVVRARLSSPELVMLFLNGYSPQGSAFTQYVERYALLDNLPSRSHGFVHQAIHFGAHPFMDHAFSSDLARKATAHHP
jgi:hypothetical protein